MLQYEITDWLPTTKEEMNRHGWEAADIIIISGDAYVDHPAFAAAMIGRVMENEGFRVAIVAQPNWKDDLRDFKKLGRPKYFFAVTSGNMDSMVNHYTANKRLRSDDAYTAGDKPGFRPDYSTTVYSKILKKIYPDVPVVIGGIEASMRRLAHYDYWSDSLKPPILIDSGADLLVYGMGELPLIEILHKLKSGVAINEMTEVPQTSFVISKGKILTKDKWQNIELSSYEDCLKSKTVFAKDFRTIETESNKISRKRLIQKAGEKDVVVNPPFPATAWNDINSFYELPFTRLPHPKYKKRGTVPAFEMIKFSVNIHRGCFGGCSFCAISAHQGKHIISRTEKSIYNEIDKIAELPDFKGIITDLGGPSANMYNLNPVNFEKCSDCSRFSCIYPKLCINLNTNHKRLIKLYKLIQSHPKVKKVFIGSGIRYDMLVDKAKSESISCHYDEYIRQLVVHHVSGRLKIAPEHTEEAVLKIIRKPSFDSFYSFKKKFDEISKNNGLRQQLIPYLMSSHPGCTEADMKELAKKMKVLNIRPEQVQGFTPTPMTLSSVIFYTGIHPYTLEPVYSARTIEEKKSQQKYFFWYKKT